MYHFSPVCDACDIFYVTFVRLFGFFSQTVDMRDELTLQDGLIFKANTVVIPRSLHADMKARVHSSHLGTESCLRRAGECIYWPGMSAEIKQYISACEICRELDTTSQPNEPLISHEVLSCPWESVGTDIFFLDGKEYLITIDYRRNFWEADRLLDSNASTVILELKSHYARHGIPDQVMSNNGPQFVSTEFATFAKTWEFDHLPSSPGNSNAKGKAESGVKTAKRLLRKSISAGMDPYLAFLDCRNTPTQAMTTSPAQRLMGRRTKTLIPTTQNFLMPKSTPSVSDTDHQRPQQDRRPPAYLRAVLHNFQLSSFGREKMKFLKLSQMNGLDK